MLLGEKKKNYHNDRRSPVGPASVQGTEIKKSSSWSTAKDNADGCVTPWECGEWQPLHPSGAQGTLTANMLDKEPRAFCFEFTQPRA